MRVTVVGQGYVGLVTAGGAAAWGHEVTGVEVSPERLHALQAGFTPFHEPGLADLIEQHLAGGLLTFTEDGAAAAATSKLTFVAVGTIDPSQRWDMNIMRSALAGVVPHIPDDGAVVVRSTCPPDFVAQLPAFVDGIRAEAGRSPIAVMLNPEFTKEGTAVRDFLNPDRVVLGVASDPRGRGASLLREFYAHVTTPILVLDAIDASLSKLGANLFLATKISFANELASLCDLYGSQIERVVEGMAYDPRIGGSFLRAGIGFGGSCLPDQVTMTVRDAASRGHETPLLAAVDLINARQRSAFADRIDSLLGGAAGQRVALLGLTFKPHTDDLRAAPSLDIARALIAMGADVVAFDPMEAARRRAQIEVEGLTVVDDAISAITGADAIGLVTEWPEFVSLPWRTVARLVARRIVVDGRNALDADVLVDAGFIYSSFGRGQRVPVEFEGGHAPAAASGRRTAAVGLELAVGE
ncbi:MAG TPA: UDP-glucose/GDP-mannose dehydrogenase family protein [Candidatus Limnocylindrales bacterium]|nr:UDP-glucose/GDP-mannose dehydrogenase family protein [Candidatus Limnocylindrales bacterium]